ncbi:MAG: hypothetical protein JXA82_15745 [Sedimentisphaerales bacterium]|nr:hypothetical protein [Sedimentisphaerales bacterium]
MGFKQKFAEVKESIVRFIAWTKTPQFYIPAMCIVVSIALGIGVFWLQGQRKSLTAELQTFRKENARQTRSYQEQLEQAQIELTEAKSQLGFLTAQNVKIRQQANASENLREDLKKAYAELNRIQAHLKGLIEVQEAMLQSEEQDKTVAQGEQ